MTRSDIRRIGKYTIQRELGRGGMGVVYLATDTDLDRDVALKMVQPSLARDERSLARFKREARAVAALSHPNIVHINALTEIEGVLLIEMPFLSEGSLRERLDGPLPPGVVAGILDAMLDALACCHDQGIIHRDVKPSNVLFDANGVPKLSDFGAVSLMESDWAAGHGERTLTLSFSGTPQYCCPEAWDGQPATPLWDLYALGMVARELLAGSARQPLSTPLAHIRQLLESDEEPIRNLVPELSEDFGLLVDRLASRDPLRRPTSAAVAQAMLRDTAEFAKAADSDARTIDFVRAGYAARNTRRSTGLRWTRWRRRVQRMAPWVLVCALGSALTISQFARVGTPAPGAATRVESRRAASPPVPTQAERFQGEAPGAEDIPGLMRESISGRSRVYTLRSAQSPGEEAHFILRAAPGGGGVSAMGLAGGYLHCLALSPGTEEGAWTVSGFAGDFSLGAAPVLRFSRVSGEAAWGGGLEQPLWLQLAYSSELTQEDWSDAVVAVPHDGPLTDTEVVLSWENHPAAMPFLFRELAPRFPVPLTPCLELLPAIAGSRLSADATLAARDVVAAGNLADARALFNTVIEGRPFAGGSWLAADRETGTFRVAIGVPDITAPLTGIDLCVLPRYGVPLVDSPYLHVALHDGAWSAARVSGAERMAVTGGWTAEVLPRADGHLVLVTMEAEALYWGGAPAPGEWHRLNAAVEQGAAEGLIRHEWGWPETGAVRHGALVELKF